MHNLRRYIRQNKKKIIRIALIIAFLIGLLQLLNYFAKEGKLDFSSNNDNKENIYATTNGIVISDKSAVTGSNVSTSKIKNANSIIEEFIKQCNNHNIEEAYNMLSDSCKEELYQNVDNFASNYYEPLFKDGNRTYTIENWSSDTYIVRITGDILATGKSADNLKYQDYITIVEENGHTKLNINKYIGKEEINKKSSSDNIEAVVLYREKYMDYEKYKIQVTNNTDGTILLDQLLETDNIYLKDSNGTKHLAISNEIIKDDLQIYQGHTSTIEIKFNNPYITGRKIKSLCFSKVVLNYDINNKAGFDEVKFSINL